MRLLPNISLLDLGRLSLKLHSWFIEGINALPNLKTLNLGIPYCETLASYAQSNPQCLRKIQCSVLTIGDRHPYYSQPAERARLSCLYAGMRVKKLVLHLTPFVLEHWKQQNWLAIEDVELVLTNGNSSFEWLQTCMNIPLGNIITSITFSSDDMSIDPTSATEVLPLLSATLHLVDESKFFMSSYTIAPVSSTAEECAEVPLGSFWRRWKVIKIAVHLDSNVKNAMLDWSRRAPYLELIDLGGNNHPDQEIKFPVSDSLLSIQTLKSIVYPT